MYVGTLSIILSPKATRESHITLVLRRTFIVSSSTLRRCVPRHSAVVDRAGRSPTVQYRAPFQNSTRPVQRQLLRPQSGPPPHATLDFDAAAGPATDSLHFESGMASGRSRRVAEYLHVVADVGVLLWWDERTDQSRSLARSTATATATSTSESRRALSSGRGPFGRGRECSSSSVAGACGPGPRPVSAATLGPSSSAKVRVEVAVIRTCTLHKEFPCLPMLLSVTTAYQSC